MLRDVPEARPCAVDIQAHEWVSSGRMPTDEEVQGALNGR